MILTPEQIKLRLKSLGIRADKFLGQHFLIDHSVLNTINQELASFYSNGDLLVEVGPGLGVLTDELLKIGPVLTIEKDPIFAQNLAEFLNNPDRLAVKQGDILDELDKDGFPCHPEPVEGSSQISRIARNDKLAWSFVANIPYGITSPLLRKLTNRANKPHHILVLVQKEVAQRIVAKPGDSNRGLLTVELEMLAQPRIVSLVPKQAFWPEPNVESAVLRLDLVDFEPLIPESDREMVRKIAIAGFSAKRKQLVNSLAGGLSIPNQEAKHLLESVGIDPQRRAETLTLQEWYALAKQTKKPA